MKDKVLRVLKWMIYPAFYFFCLVIFGYITFPFNSIKDRILGEIAKSSKGKNAPTVTIDQLDSYWLSGVEAEGIKIRIPADPATQGFGALASGPAYGFGGGSTGGASVPPKDSVIVVQEAHARARILPLLIGRVQLDFWANVFGGEISGTAPTGSSKGDVELTISDAKLSQVDPLQNLLEIPIDGKVNGALTLSPTDGKFNKSSGKLELSVKNIVLGDGKSKILGILAIPAAKVDELVVTGEADKGVMKITKFSAPGPDIEIEGDGKINLREPWAESSVDMYVKFRFTDAYRGKDATTKSLLGEPGSVAPGLIEMQATKLKKAKRSDGFYGFHVHGKLKKLDFTPSATETSGSRKTSKGSDSTPTPAASTGKRPGGVALPLGVSTALQNRDKDKEAEEKKEEEKKEEPAEEKKEEPPPTPEDRPRVPVPPNMRNLMPGIGAPPPGGGDAPQEPPSINAPPNPDNPGGEPPAAEERPVEEPR
ncbi:MAG: type II secretion system protein GspN [Polyangiaceae bacterium]|nr:type II secretion system protein GspN [Polyangiaceae bacterium]